MSSSEASDIKRTLRRLRVFLCYASEDRNKVRVIRDYLASLPWVRTWMDEDILPGIEWERAILNALKKSDVVIVCLSRHSVAKEGFVQREIRHAIDIASEKPEGVVFLIPIRLDNCRLPYDLDRWQSIDMFANQGQATEKLTVALAARANIVWTRQLTVSTVSPRNASELHESRSELPIKSLSQDRKIIKGGSTKPKPLLAILGVIGLFLSVRYYAVAKTLFPLAPLLPIISILFWLDVIKYWLFKEPALIIRRQQTDEFDSFAEYVVDFSVANRRNRPLVINSIVFRIGDYESEGPPPFMYVVIHKFDRKIHLTFVGNREGIPFVVIDEQKTEHSMGKSKFAVLLLQHRGLLGPLEQVDFSLVIKLQRPPELKSKYPTVWKLGGRLFVNYEDGKLKDQTIVYP